MARARKKWRSIGVPGDKSYLFSIFIDCRDGRSFNKTPYKLGFGRLHGAFGKRWRADRECNGKKYSSGNYPHRLWRASDRFRNYNVI